ncbi:hypothetical protein HDU67_008993 [Dinochytrium kinnereticum]|nr:hypothetical protein HDU67_008993 [Dinochytrium kinnereticum]
MAAAAKGKTLPLPPGETDPLLPRSDSHDTLIGNEHDPAAAAASSSSSSPSSSSSHSAQQPSTMQPPTTRNPNHWLGYHPSPIMIVPALFLHVFALACFIMPFSQFLLLVVCQMLGGDGVPNQSPLTGFDSSAPSSMSWWRGFDPASFPNYETCAKRGDVQKLTAWWSQIISLASAVPLFTLAPVMGTLVDMFGRRTIMIFPIISSLIGLASVIAVAQFGFGLWTLVAVHVLQGFMGGQPALITCVYAYLADSSDSSKRTEKFLLVDAFMFSAFTFGPAIGGMMARWPGVLFAFYFTFTIECLVLLYIIFILPESRRTSPQTSSASSPPQKKSLLKIFTSAWASTLEVLAAPGRGWSVRVLALVTAIAAMVFAAYGPAFFLYPAKRFGWDGQDAGIFSFVNSVMRVSYLGGILPVLRGWLLEGRSSVGKIRMELMLIRVGILFYVFGFLAYGLATKGWMFYLIAILDGFGIVALPTIRGILSRTVPNSRQGRLFAALETLQSGMGLVSGVFIPIIYRATIDGPVPQAIFFVVSGIWAFALTASAWVKSRELVSLTPEEDREEGGPAVAEGGGGEGVKGVGEEVEEGVGGSSGTVFGEGLEALEQEAEVLVDEAVRELQIAS